MTLRRPSRKNFIPRDHRAVVPSGNRDRPGIFLSVFFCISKPRISVHKGIPPAASIQMIDGYGFRHSGKSLCAAVIDKPVKTASGKLKRRNPVFQRINGTGIRANPHRLPIFIIARQAAVPVFFYYFKPAYVIKQNRRIAPVNRLIRPRPVFLFYQLRLFSCISLL